jgi:transcriptional regulator with XRE-family HTH domain
LADHHYFYNRRAAALGTDGEQPLRALRIEARLRQADVAEALGVTHMTVSRWSRGQTRPTRAQRRALVDLLVARLGRPLTEAAVFTYPRKRGSARRGGRFQADFHPDQGASNQPNRRQPAHDLVPGGTVSAATAQHGR